MKKFFLLPAEIWADILGYEGLYQASNLGQVRSINRIDSLGHHRKGKILNPLTRTDGYQQVILCKDGVRKCFQIHRLVYAAFCGEIPSGMEVNHINECKTDNRLCNLNLMTKKENINYGSGIERRAKAQKNHPRKSKPVIGYDADGNVVVTFPSTSEAGRNGYDHSAVSACCRGEKYYHSYKGLRWKYADEDC